MAAGGGLEPPTFRWRSFRDCLLTFSAARQTRAIDPRYVREDRLDVAVVRVRSMGVS